MALTNRQLDSALAGLSSATAAAVRSTVTSATFSGQLDAILKEAETLLPLAASFSIHPVSEFAVGAVALGQSGQMYLCANLEFQGLPLNATLHAEQSALLNAWMHDEKAVQALYVSETPCGHCRQFLRELPNLDTLKIHTQGQSHSLDELLPHAFGEARVKGHGLLDSRSINLGAVHPETDTLMQHAINAAQRSYVPYSHSPEGFVLECADGHFFCGRAVESAAFNPSVPGVLVALNQRNLSASRSATITRAIQAMLPSAISPRLDFARALIRSVSEAPIEVVQMEPREGHLRLNH